MAKLRFRGLSRRRGERRVEVKLRIRRSKPLPPLPFEGVPPRVLDLGWVGREESAPVDLGVVEWRPGA